MDSDGSFSVQYTNTDNGAKKRKISCRLRIEQRVLDPITSASYFDILTKIVRYLNVNLYFRTKEKGEKIFYAFMVISHNNISHKKVMEYFDKFPLYSSKYLAYKDWAYLVKKNIARNSKPLSKEDIVEIEQIKSQFNSKRKFWDFSHLNNII